VIGDEVEHLLSGFLFAWAFWAGSRLYVSHRICSRSEALCPTQKTGDNLGIVHLAVLLHGVLIGLLVVKVAEDPGTVEPKVKQLASGIADRIYLSQLG